MLRIDNMNMWRIVFYLTLFATAFSTQTNAQYENVWAFGINAGLDFSTGTPVPIRTAINSNESSASVCDITGRLLFYTDGFTVWNRNNNQMPDGDTICPRLTGSTSQGSVIIPMPDSANKYYIFSITSYEVGAGDLYYSVINMDLNGGLGGVESGRKAIKVTTGLTEQMTVVSGEKCNVWLLTIDREDSLKAFSIDYRGINLNPIVTSIERSSNLPILAAGIPGTICVAPNKRKVAIARTSLVIYDFDPYTGVPSNPIPLDRGISTNYYSVCFSPDNSKLYATDFKNLVINQFDLSSNDSIMMASSATFLSGVYGSVKLAPDNKLYIASITRTSLDVINFPNLAGVACQYMKNELPLAAGTSCVFGLPNVVPIMIKDTLTNHFFIDTCFVAEVQIQAQSGGERYIWGTGDTGSMLMVNQPGIYFVRYITYPCTIHIDTFTVLFDSRLPGFGTYAGCKGDTNAKVWTLLVPGDTITYAYTWLTNTGIIKGPVQSNTGDTLLNIAPGTYFLHISAPNGCDTTLEVIIDMPAYQTSFTTDTVVCMNEPINIQNTSSADFTSWKWNFGDGNTSVLKDPVHAYGLAGEYRVSLVSSPCMDSAYRIIKVEPVPVVFAGNDTIVCYDEIVILHPVIEPSYPFYIFNWNPASLLNVSGDHILNPFFIAKSDQNFKLVVTTPNGCEGEDDILVKVRPEHFTKIAPSDTSLCTADTLQIRITGDALSFNWQPSLWISNTTIDTPLIYVPSSMTYQLTGTDIYGCKDSQEINIRKYPAAVVNMPDSVVVYAGDPYQINPEGNCTYFTWFPPLGLNNDRIDNPIIAPDVNTRYFVKAMTEQGCVTMDSINVLVSYDAYLDLPNAFTPAKELNGELRILKRGEIILKSYRIYNRWGHLVFETTDINRGWDGHLNGSIQPTGVYIYQIEAYIYNGKKIIKQGNITLL